LNAENSVGGTLVISKQSFSDAIKIQTKRLPSMKVL